MKYESIIVIGSGKIACECINILISYTDRVTCIEHEIYPLSFVKLICKKNNIDYKLIESKKKLLQYFLSISKETLIISANNNFIFPARVLNKDNLRIINFHNSLLPRYRGRNSSTWVIFNMEEFTGVTWHEVDLNIDTGNIIKQEKILMNDEITALELTKRIMDVGAKTFDEIILSVLNDIYEVKKQDHNAEKGFYYSHDIPNNGLLDISWSIDKISAFLRSLDYGKSTILPRPRINILGKQYLITNYKIECSKEKREKTMILDREKIIFSDKEKSIRIGLEST